MGTWMGDREGSPGCGLAPKPPAVPVGTDRTAFPHRQKSLKVDFKQIFFFFFNLANGLFFVFRQSFCNTATNRGATGEQPLAGV